jgi:purine-nucleoside phosphorylase
MSTVPEAIVAAQARVPALGISLITNHAAGVSQQPLSHAEVLAVGKRAAGSIAEWLEKLVPLLPGLAPKGRTPRRPAKRSGRRR